MSSNKYQGYELSPGGYGATGGVQSSTAMNPIGSYLPAQPGSISSMSPTQQAATFGTKIAQIGAPPSIYDQLKENVPNYAGLTAASGANVANELSGRLSTGTENFLRDKAAALGINMGQPGGTAGNTLTNQNFLHSLGLTSEGLAHEGVGDYNQLINTAASQQQNPALLLDLAETNATNAAAPNPAAAQSYAQNLFQKYIDQESKPVSHPSTFVWSRGTQPSGQPATIGGGSL